MSSFRPDRRFTVLSLAALAACGFTPAYGPNGPASALRGTIEVEAPTNKNAFDFVTQLEQRLGLPETPRYVLSYSLETREDRVGLTPKQEIIRYQIFGSANFTIRDVETGEVLTKGTVDNFTSYSVGVLDVTSDPPQTSSTIATLAAKRDANVRLVIALADQVVSRLQSTAGSWAT